MAAATPKANPDATVTLYTALATHAGARRPVTVEDPEVACDVLVRHDGTRFAVSTSHANEALYRANQAVLKQTQAVDTWSQFQAESVK